MAYSFQNGDTLFIWNGSLAIGELAILKRPDGEVEVPVADLLAFAASVVVREKVRALENASDAAILGLPERV